MRVADKCIVVPQGNNEPCRTESVEREKFEGVFRSFSTDRDNILGPRWETPLFTEHVSIVFDYGYAKPF